MKALSIVCAALALLVCAAIPLKSFAEDEAKMSAAQIAAGQTKAGVANTLIVIGRATKDPDMMMAAARLLAAIDAPVADPKASSEGKPVFYDVDAIVAEADGYAADRAAKPASRTYAGFGHYEYWCDSLSCSYVWVC
jgi:hypothetical protein